MPTLRTFAILLLVSTLLAGAHLTCKKKPTEPPNDGPDTTSHAFTFVLDTLGDGNSSFLSDVFIISENNVIAVGEIFLRDSLGGFGEPAYGIAQWDGTRWNLRRVHYQTQQGPLNIAPIRGIWRSGQGEIWLAAGSVFRWNGSSELAQMVVPRLSLGDPNATVEKLWGTATSLYGVGRAGTVVLITGTNWQKLTTGTTVDIQDIYGAVDARTGQTEILAVASFQNYGQGLNLLRIVGTTVTRLDTSGLRRSQSSVWFIPGIRYYVAGDGLFWKGDLNAARWEIDTAQPNYFKRRARGNTAHDVFVVGDFGLASHFNGSTWRHYTGVEFPQFFGSLVSVATRGDQVVGVGEISDRAIVLRGRRTH
jgi:hypothetical protein